MIMGLCKEKPPHPKYFACAAYTYFAVRSTFRLFSPLFYAYLGSTSAVPSSTPILCYQHDQTGLDIWSWQCKRSPVTSLPYKPYFCIVEVRFHHCVL